MTDQNSVFQKIYSTNYKQLLQVSSFVVRVRGDIQNQSGLVYENIIVHAYFKGSGY